MACVSWNACWIFDFLLILQNPLRNTASNLRFYHLFVWVAAAVSTAAVLGMDAHSAADDHTCWIRGDSTNSLVFTIPLYLFLILGAASLVFAFIRLRQGTASTYASRRRLLARHAAYVIAFIGLWLWPIVHHVFDDEDTLLVPTLLDVVAVSTQGFVFACIRLAEPGAWALFTGIMARWRDAIMRFLCFTFCCGRAWSGRCCCRMRCRRFGTGAYWKLGGGASGDGDDDAVVIVDGGVILRGGAGGTAGVMGPGSSSPGPDGLAMGPGGAVAVADAAGLAAALRPGSAQSLHAGGLRDSNTTPLLGRGGYQNGGSASAAASAASMGSQPAVFSSSGGRYVNPLLAPAPLPLSAAGSQVGLSMTLVGAAAGAALHGHGHGSSGALPAGTPLSKQLSIAASGPLPLASSSSGIIVAAAKFTVRRPGDPSAGTGGSESPWQARGVVHKSSALSSNAAASASSNALAAPAVSSVAATVASVLGGGDYYQALAGDEGDAAAAVCAAGFAPARRGLVPSPPPPAAGSEATAGGVLPLTAQASLQQLLQARERSAAEHQQGASAAGSAAASVGPLSSPVGGTAGGLSAFGTPNEQTRLMAPGIGSAHAQAHLGAAAAASLRSVSASMTTSMTTSTLGAAASTALPLGKPPAGAPGGKHGKQLHSAATAASASAACAGAGDGSIPLFIGGHLAPDGSSSSSGTSGDASSSGSDGSAFVPASGSAAVPFTGSTHVSAAEAAAPGLDVSHAAAHAEQQHGGRNDGRLGSTAGTGSGSGSGLGMLDGSGLGMGLDELAAGFSAPSSSAGSGAGLPSSAASGASFDSQAAHATAATTAAAHGSSSPFEASLPVARPRGASTASNASASASGAAALAVHPAHGATHLAAAVRYGLRSHAPIAASGVATHAHAAAATTSGSSTPLPAGAGVGSGGGVSVPGIAGSGGTGTSPISSSVVQSSQGSLHLHGEGQSEGQLHGRGPGIILRGASFQGPQGHAGSLSAPGTPQTLTASASASLMGLPASGGSAGNAVGFAAAGVSLGAATPLAQAGSSSGSLLVAEHVHHGTAGGTSGGTMHDIRLSPAGAGAGAGASGGAGAGAGAVPSSPLHAAAVPSAAPPLGSSPLAHGAAASLPDARAASAGAAVGLISPLGSASPALDGGGRAAAHPVATPAPQLALPPAAGPGLQRSGSQSPLAGPLSAGTSSPKPPSQPQQTGASWDIGYALRQEEAACMLSGLCQALLLSDARLEALNKADAAAAAVAKARAQAQAAAAAAAAAASASDGAVDGYGSSVADGGDAAALAIAGGIDTCDAASVAPDAFDGDASSVTASASTATGSAAGSAGVGAGDGASTPGGTGVAPSGRRGPFFSLLKRRHTNTGKNTSPAGGSGVGPSSNPASSTGAAPQPALSAPAVLRLPILEAIDCDDFYSKALAGEMTKLQASQPQPPGTAAAAAATAAPAPDVPTRRAASLPAAIEPLGLGSESQAGPRHGGAGGQLHAQSESALASLSAASSTGLRIHAPSPAMTSGGEDGPAAALPGALGPQAPAALAARGGHATPSAAGSGAGATPVPLPAMRRYGVTTLAGAASPAAQGAHTPAADPARKGAPLTAAAGGGSSGGGGSKGSQFELTSYADCEFAELRAAAALRASQAVYSLDPVLLRTGALRASFSDGASSSFFCRSVDQLLVVKTISEGELKELLRLLPAYSRYLLANPDSLLCRFYGAFSLKLSSTLSSRVFFLLMGNVFPIVEAGPGAETFDLKGSTVGRRARISKSMAHAQQAQHGQQQGSGTGSSTGGAGGAGAPGSSGAGGSGGSGSGSAGGVRPGGGMLLQDMEFRERYPHGLPAVDALPRIQDMPLPTELLPTLPVPTGPAHGASSSLAAAAAAAESPLPSGISAGTPTASATATTLTALTDNSGSEGNEGSVPASLDAALATAEASSASAAAPAAAPPSHAHAHPDAFPSVPPVTAWPSDLVLGWDRSQAIVNQLAKDTALLACHGLMDYSLLVSVVPIADYAPPAYAAEAAAGVSAAGAAAGDASAAAVAAAAPVAAVAGEPVSWLLQPDREAPMDRDGTQAWKWVRLPGNASSNAPAAPVATSLASPAAVDGKAAVAPNALLSSLGFSSFYGHSEEEQHALPAATAGGSSGAPDAAVATGAAASASVAATSAAGNDSPSVLRITRAARASSASSADADAACSGVAAGGIGHEAAHQHADEHHLVLEHSHSHGDGHASGHRDRTSSMLRLVPAVVDSSSAVTPYAGLGADAVAAPLPLSGAAGAGVGSGADHEGTIVDGAGEDRKARGKDDGSNDDDGDDDDDVAISFRLSLNKAPSLSFADCLHLVHAAASLPRQIASFGRSPRHFIVPAGFDASLAAAAAAGFNPSYGHSGNSGRVTRWSPLAVSVCALGTPRQLPASALDSSPAASASIAAPASAGVRLRSPLTFSGRALVQIGVVDMLQAYDVGKKVEFTFKTLRHAVAHASLAAADISSVDPVAYAARFNTFVGHIFTPAPGGFAFWRDPTDIATIAVASGHGSSSGTSSGHGATATAATAQGAAPSHGSSGGSS